MSEVAHKGVHGMAYESSYVDEERQATGWVGWVGFAGFMMLLSGVFQAIAGLVALFRDTFYVVTSSQILVLNDIHTWGWVNLIVGIIVALAGVSLFSGTTWSRIVAVLFAMGAAIVNMAWLPLYPIWSIICIALSILVIYAVVAHGGELKEG